MTTDDLERRALYHEIRGIVAGDMATYYRRHPDRLTDERGNDAQQCSYDGLKKILSLLDQYNIQRKDPAVPPREMQL